MVSKLTGGWLVVVVVGLAVASSASAASSTVPIGCTNGVGDSAGLIAAIATADQSSTPSTLSLAAGCTYTFTSAYLGSAQVESPSNTLVGLKDWYGPSALPAIATSITIDGNGATLAATQPSTPVQTTTGFDPDFRFFFVGADPSSKSTPDYASPGAGVLTLNDLTLSGGRVHGGTGEELAGGGAGMGGAIFNQGTLSLNAVTVTNNTAVGGGVRADGAAGAGGGMATDADTGNYGGGGGFGPGTFGGAAGSTGTDAYSGGGGGFAVTDTAPAGGAGGGPSTGLGAAANGGAFEKAGGDGSGGGTTYSGAGITDGTGGAFGSGGAANGNAPGGAGGVGGGSGYGSGSGFGGGAGTDGDSGFGGGAETQQGLSRLPTSGFGGGDGGAGMGGAIFNMQGSVQITNSTLTANTATGGNGNRFGDPSGNGLGGAVFNLNGSVQVLASTLDANTAAQGGGGVYNLGYYTNPSSTTQTPLASLTVDNSIIYNDTADDVQDNAPSTTSAGANSSSATETDTTSDIGTRTVSASGQDTSSGAVTGNPQLAGLASNGGPGMATQLLGSGSVAIGAGSNCPVVDERGVTSATSSCDIGAVQELAPTVTITSPTATTYGLDQNVLAAYSCADPTGPGNPSCTGTVASGQPINTSTAGQHTFSVTTVSGDGLKSTVPVTYTVGQDTPTTSVACGPTSTAGSAQTCTVTVSDTANPINIPTGTVTFSTTGSAVLSPNSCLLSGGSCSVSYTPSQADTETVTGRYSGDNNDVAGTGTTTATATPPPATTTTTTSTVSTTTTTTTSTSTTTSAPGLAVGPFTGAGLPPLVLGQTRSEASGLAEYQRTSAAPGLQLFFSGSGVTRAGIASAKMLARIHTNRHYLNDVVWILTSNPADSIHGITPGMTVTQAASHLHLPAAQRVGANDWYLAPDGTVTAMLRTQNGKVIEVGVAVRSLSDGSRHRRFGFLAGFS